jgi:O-antigen ligase
MGYVMKLSPLIPTAHAYLSLLVGLGAALAASKREYAVYALAYITGAEVLWRMTLALTFWEFGKYAVIAIALASIVRRGLFRHAGLPLFYVFLLLPSIVLPSANVGDSELRQSISFNLSGPFALAVSWWYCANLNLTRTQVLRACLALAGPVISVAATVLTGILTVRELQFGSYSNQDTSGGFGPNQVSSLLALGVLLFFFFMLLEKTAVKVKAMLVTVMIWLLAQCVMTFSRTGFYLALASLLAATLYLVRDGRMRLKLLGAFAVCGLAAVFFVLPALERFTEGALTQRFSRVDTTGRDQVALVDLKIWADNPVFGVGPGLAPAYRAKYYREIAAHTEFTRLLAEHGVFGLVALFMMFVLGIVNFWRARTIGQRAFVLGLLTWSYLFMLTTAMRTATPCVVMALTAIRWRLEEHEMRSS